MDSSFRMSLGILGPWQRRFKRVVDIAGAIICLLISLPVVVIAAILIKIEDGGPVFYCAPRVGENGKEFIMYKLRSMRVDSTQETPPHPQALENKPHKRVGDARVTRVGAWLRRTSIDEYPQLFNVLIGDMSLVGPRPELPWIVRTYEPWQLARLTVPQGITGWWQVSGRSERTMHLHVDLDLYYIQNYSLGLDFKILFKTFGVVLSGKGAF